MIFTKMLDLSKYRGLCRLNSSAQIYVSLLLTLLVGYGYARCSWVRGLEQDFSDVVLQELLAFRNIQECS